MVTFPVQSKFSISNKLLVCKTILERNWTYGIELWGAASTWNIELLERFQSKALRMIVDEAGMCRIRLSEKISKHQQLLKKSSATALSTALASEHSKPHGATRQKAIAKTLAKLSAYQIPSVIVFLILVFKVSFVCLVSLNATRGIEIISYRAALLTLFYSYMPLYIFLCFFTQFAECIGANKMGLQTKKKNSKLRFIIHSQKSF
jgi:hypothetical protein